MTNNVNYQKMPIIAVCAMVCIGCSGSKMPYKNATESRESVIMNPVAHVLNIVIQRRTFDAVFLIKTDKSILEYLKNENLDKELILPSDFEEAKMADKPIIFIEPTLNSMNAHQATITVSTVRDGHKTTKEFRLIKNNGNWEILSEVVIEI